MSRKGDNKNPAEKRLPREILARATLRGNEYAWPVDDIPLVIEAARQAELVNIGGQLQFHLKENTCECYWVEVDTGKPLPESLPYRERVEKSAAIALKEFNRLKEEIDFAAEGRSAFPEALGSFEADGGALSEIMCFVWYVSEE